MWLLAILLIATSPASARQVSANVGREEPGGSAVVHRAGGRPVENAGGRVPKARLFRIGQEAGEPTLGLTRNGDVFITAFFDSVRVEPVRSTGVELLRSTDGGRKWTDVSPRLPGGENAHRISVDPYVYVDEKTDRVFTIDLTLACSYLSFSDDGGNSWVTNPLACGRPINDHQTLFSGKPVSSQTVGYDNIVYYCFSDIALSSACSKSLDGGITFVPTGAHAFTAIRPGSSQGSLDRCGGMHGHGITDRHGTIYLPREYCGAAYLAISRDEGASWTRIEVAPKARIGDPTENPSVDVDGRGNIYYGWIQPDGLPYLTVSRDGGKTWSQPMMIAAPGVVETNLLTLDAGKPGALAFAYMGTQGTGPTKTWNGYMGVTFGALADHPLFSSATVNPEVDPLKRGACGPGRCGRVLDFIDIVIGRDGTPWASFVDACDVGCARTARDGGWEGVVGRLVGGPSLR